MATTLQFKRYSTAALSAQTGASGELIVDTSKTTITVHDGATAGGVPLATETFVTSALNSLNASISTTLVSYATKSFVTSALTSYASIAYVTSSIAAISSTGSISTDISFPLISTTSNLVLDFSKGLLDVNHTTSISSVSIINGPAAGKSATLTVILKQTTTGGCTITGSFSTQDGLGLSIDTTTSATNIVSFLAINVSSATLLYGFVNGTNLL
jgi:Major tropism determinant N-terminal domain